MIWKGIKETIHFELTTSKFVFKIFENNHLITYSKLVADAFNTYFANVVKFLNKPLFKNNYASTLNNASVKITYGLVPKERICGAITGILFCRCRSLSLSFHFCSSHRSSRHHVTLSEHLKICQKL